MSLWDNLLFDALVVLIVVFIAIYLFFWVLNKLFPNYKTWLNNIGKDKDVSNVLVRCQSLSTHNFSNIEDENCKCAWCGQSISEVKNL